MEVGREEEGKRKRRKEEKKKRNREKKKNLGGFQVLKPEFISFSKF